MSEASDLVVRRAAFDDPARQGASLDGWSLRYVQMSAGRFAGTSWIVRMPGIEVLRETNNTTLNEFGVPCSGRLVFGSAMRAAGDTLLDGRCLGCADIGLVDGNREIDTLQPPMDVVVLAVDEPVLREFILAQEPLQATFGLHRGPVCIPDPKRAARFRARLSGVLDTLGAGEKASAPQMEALREELLSVAASLLESLGSSPRPPLTAYGRCQLVKRTREFIMDRIDEPLQVSTLCRALRVSRRSLQYAFQEFLGTTPAVYLRVLRLNGARGDLLCSQGRVQVQEVMARWGFWHGSRFSAEYRAMFGELPSATLAAQRA